MRARQLIIIASLALVLAGCTEPPRPAPPASAHAARYLALGELATPSELGAAIAERDTLLAAEAKARGQTFVDLGPLMEKQADERLLARDGLHPSADAYDAWAAELARVLPSPCGR